MEKMDGKVIVITGGSSGMGAAMARDFAMRGAKIAIFDLDEEKGENLIAEIGDAATYYKIDVTAKEDIHRGISAVEEKYGPLTTLVNSAGVSKMVPFLESTEELWDLTMDVNLKATFLCCQAAIERMLEHGGGEILNMSSLSGKKLALGKPFIVLASLGYKD